MMESQVLNPENISLQRSPEQLMKLGTLKAFKKTTKKTQYCSSSVISEIEMKRYYLHPIFKPKSSL